MKNKGIEFDDVGYSKVKNKKYYVIYRGKRINFGDKRYTDYLITGDKEQRKRYRLRHAKDNINDPYSPGYYSWRVLW